MEKTALTIEQISNLDDWTKLNLSYFVDWEVNKIMQSVKTSFNWRTEINLPWDINPWDIPSITEETIRNKTFIIEVLES